MKTNCLNCGKKTVGENLCPKCRKTVKVVPCTYCGKDIVRDKVIPTLIYECKECSDRTERRANMTEIERMNSEEFGDDFDLGFCSGCEPDGD